MSTKMETDREKLENVFFFFLFFCSFVFQKFKVGGIAQGN